MPARRIPKVARRLDEIVTAWYSQWPNGQIANMTSADWSPVTLPPTRPDHLTMTMKMKIAAKISKPAMASNQKSGEPPPCRGV